MQKQSKFSLPVLSACYTYCVIFGTYGFGLEGTGLGLEGWRLGLKILALTTSLPELAGALRNGGVHLSVFCLFVCSSVCRLERMLLLAARAGQTAHGCPGCLLPPVINFTPP